MATLSEESHKHEVVKGVTGLLKQGWTESEVRRFVEQTLNASRS